MRWIYVVLTAAIVSIIAIQQEETRTFLPSIPNTIESSPQAPTLTAVPTSTSTPTPTSTSTPNSPTPTSTPTQTLTPEPTSTSASPTPTQPAAIQHNGSGNNITPDFEFGYPLAFVEFQGVEEGYFGIEMRNAETGEYVDLIANEIGATEGATLAPVEPGSFFYQVEADGTWSISTSNALQWSREPGSTPYNLTGSDSSVPPIFSLNEGRADFRLTHDGDGYFGATLYRVDNGDYVDLLANDIGIVDTTTATNVDHGEYVIDIDANGNWTIEITQ